MDEVLQLLETAIDASENGEVTYGAFFNGLDYRQQQLLPRAINLGKANGTIQQRLVWNADTKKSTHVISRVAP